MRVGLSVAVQLGMDATAVRDDAFDSPLYGWTWLVFPLAAGLSSAWRPGPLTPLLFTAALVFPMLIGTFLVGAVFYDGSGGASFWPLSEIINLFQRSVVAACAYLGAMASTRLRSRWG